MFSTSKNVAFAIVLSIPILVIVYFNFNFQSSSSSSSSSAESSSPPEMELVPATMTPTSSFPSNSSSSSSFHHKRSALDSSSSSALYFNTKEEYDAYRKQLWARVEELLETKTTKGSPEAEAVEQELLRIINPPPSPPPQKGEDHATYAVDESSTDKNKRRRFYRNEPTLPCPYFRYKIGKDADSKSSSAAVVKYTRYTHQFCNSSGMLQMFFGLRRYLFFLDIMSKIVNLKEGDRVFDLGSGCGTLLNFYHLKYGTSGLGIDLTSDAVAHAKIHARENQTFCQLDATLLRAFPSNYFDAIVSWAVLYHIRRSWVQCAIMHDLARMLKPGGVAMIAQIRTEKTQVFWKKGKCKIAGARWRRLTDANTFHEKSFKRNGFFSIYLVKDGGQEKNVTTMKNGMLFDDENVEKAAKKENEE